MDKGKVLQGMQMLLEGLGVDMDDNHFKKTPERAAKSWVEEICSGLGEKKFRMFLDDVNSIVSKFDLIPVCYLTRAWVASKS